MRAAPFGILLPGDPSAAADLAEQDARVSHSRDGIDGARAIAAVSVAMTGARVEDVVEAALAAVDEDSWTARASRRALALVEDAGPSDDTEAIEQRLYDEISVLGYSWADSAPEAVAFALAAVVVAGGDPVRAIAVGVNMGRDSDTIAAMAGAICGARAGLDALHPEWVDRVRQVHGVCVTATRGADLIDLADALVTRSAVSTAAEESVR